MFRIVLFCLLFTNSLSEAFADCLSDVSNFAEKICGQIKTSGNTQLIEANGELKAEVSGIVRKALGDVKGNINGKVLHDTYENVLRENLSTELFNVRECRQKMADSALSVVCSSSDDKVNNQVVTTTTTGGDNTTAIVNNTGNINIDSDKPKN